jgi:hypothetical protein
MPSAADEADKFVQPDFDVLRAPVEHAVALRLPDRVNQPLIDLSRIDVQVRELHRVDSGGPQEAKDR